MNVCWTCSSIVLGNPNWSWFPLVSALAAIALLVLVYASVQRPLLWKTSLAILKLLAVVLIAACLLNPMWSRESLQPGENLVLIVADNSASLQIRADGETSRGNAIQKLLQYEPVSEQSSTRNWQQRLAEDFSIRRYQFGDRLAVVDNFSELNFESSASQLNATLTQLQQRYADQPVAAMLLLTDGNATDVDEFTVGDESPFPIFPVKWNDDSEVLRDIRIQNVSVSQSAFEDAPVNVAVSFVAEYFDDETVRVSLEEIPINKSEQAGETSSEPEMIEEQTLNCGRGSPVTARFQVRSQHAGFSYYRVRVIATGEEAAFEGPSLSNEITLANNERLLSIDRGDEKHRILYVGGRPNWEYKFLNRALSEDESVNMVSLIRIARKEAKFDFRGRAGESSNSLFRGFKDEVDAETESYDEAVVVRLNAADMSELSDGFPKTKAELYTYKAVILDDVETKFFSHDQLVLLDRFVTERGGGLLMLGGRDSYRHGEWHKSPIKDALPIYLDRPGMKPTGSLRWDLTREGWLEPWMRLRETEEKDRERLVTMPPFQLLNATQELKPGSRMLATVQDESNTEIPSLVVQQYGKGRTGAVMIGDMWKWSLQRDETDQDDLAKSWRQTVRWLVGDVPLPVETSLEWTQLGNIPAVNLQVSVRDEEFQPQDNAAVTLSIRQPNGTTLELNAVPSLEQPGLFEATFVSRSAGAFEATASVVNEDGLAAGQAAIGWTHNPASKEFQRVAINDDFLKSVAVDSGGEVVLHDQLDKFVDQLPQRELPVMKTETTPLWHTPWLLLIAISCLASEWGLRRWRGLA